MISGPVVDLTAHRDKLIQNICRGATVRIGRRGPTARRLSSTSGRFIHSKWSCELNYSDYEDLMGQLLSWIVRQLERGATVRFEIDFYGKQRVVFRPVGRLPHFNKSILHLADRHIQVLRDAAHEQMNSSH